MSRGELGTQVSYEYNADSQQSKITYPSGRKTLYSYDLNGNLLTATIDGIGAVEYTYDERNTQTSTTLPNGVTESFVNDELGRTTSIDISNVTEILHKVTRDYTANSNVQSSSIGSINPVVETYSHDSLNRTTGTSSAIAGADGLNEYNDANHIIKMMGETVVSDKTGKPSSVGTKSLSYDALGNRTQEVNNATSETLNLDWTIDGSLSSYENISQAKDIDYEYGSNGLLSQRESTVDNVVTTQDMEWNENTSNALMISDGEFEYVYGANRVPVAQINIETNEIQYLHSDFVGSVIAVTDNTSNIESILNYGAYGKRIGANVTRFGFAGEWVDTDTGYSYNRARWYDSSTAHFLSKDPLVQSTQEAYGYVGGNPLTRIDPSGAIWCHEENDFNFWTSSCFGFTDTEEFETISSVPIGIGDGGSFGITTAIRDLSNIDHVVDKCSETYKIGNSGGETILDFLTRGKRSAIAAGVNNISNQIQDDSKEYFTADDHPFLDGIENKSSANQTNPSKVGIIYFRIDDNGIIAPYVGQAKSEERFAARKREHAKKFPQSSFSFIILERTRPNDGKITRWLSVAEESYIRIWGIAKEGGKLSNSSHAMVEEKYQNYRNK